MRIDKGSFNKRNGRIGYFLKSETKTLKNNKIGEKKHEEREKKRSISLRRTWYVEVSAFIIVNSSLTLLKVQNDKKIPFWR